MTPYSGKGESAVERTRNEDLVLGVLSHADAPKGAYAILDALRAQGFRSALQVYRALDKLMGRGLVDRLESLNAYVPCAEYCLEPHTTAFAIWDKCCEVTESQEAAVERSLAVRGRRHGFHRHASSVELRGLCGNCVLG